MQFEITQSPLPFLQSTLTDVRLPDWVPAYQSWWEKEGQAISDATDRAGTPWLRMFDLSGTRADEILYAPEYWRMLRRGYQSGLIWRVLEESSMIPAGLGVYVTSFYDPGLACPYTVTLSTMIPVLKYGNAELRERFLPRLAKKDDRSWQGATWMTEIKGGSDLGATVETVARPAGSQWLLTGEKYFASNVGAELAVVAARPENAPLNGAVPGSSLSRRWPTQLFHPPPQEQDRNPLGADRRG